MWIYLEARTRFVCICIAAHHHSEPVCAATAVYILSCSLRVVFNSWIMHEVKMKCLCRFSLAATCAAVISMNWPSAHSFGQDPLKFMNNQPLPPPPHPLTPTVRPTALCRDNFSINTGPNCNSSTHSTTLSAHYSLFSLPMVLNLHPPPTPPIRQSTLLAWSKSLATRWPGFCHPRETQCSINNHPLALGCACADFSAGEINRIVGASHGVWLDEVTFSVCWKLKGGA